METTTVRNFTENEVPPTTSTENSSTDAVEQNNAEANNAQVNEFTREKVETEEQVRLVNSDPDSGLDLFCYTHCTNDDSDFVQQCRGLVFHGNDLVMKAFSYNPEYNHTELAPLEQELADFGKWSCHDSYEGTLLRLFHFNGKWFLSTHRKLDAFHSKWSSRESFGALFVKALQAEYDNVPEFRQRLSDYKNGQDDDILAKFEQTLDVKNQYMFLLCCSEENRIVCIAPPRPTVFHVGTFTGPDNLDTTIECGLPKPPKHHFLNIDELLHHIQNRVDPQYLQGVICFGPNNRQIKIVHKEYQNLFRVRGNEPSVKFRYLQIRTDREMRRKLYMLYPNMTEIFDDYENTLREIVAFIHKTYIHKFVGINGRKINNRVPKEEYAVISECHGWHCADRRNNIVTQKKVANVLNNQRPTSLNHMIRRHKLKKDQEQNPRSYESSPAINPVNLQPLLLNQTNRLPPAPVLKI